MNAADLVRVLEEAGVHLWVEGDKLRYRAQAGSLSPEQRAWLGEQKAAVLDLLRRRAGEAVRHEPLSWNQRAMWFIHQDAPSSASYNVAFAAKVTSPVDVAALRGAFQALVDRHAILRTTYEVMDGVPVQRILGWGRVVLEQPDVRGLSDDALRQQVQADIERPFDLENGPILRVALYTRSEADHALLILLPHIATDGLSMFLLLDEFKHLYAGLLHCRAVHLPTPAATYADFVHWQQGLLDGPEGQRLWDYWRGQLAEPRAVLELPGDHRRQRRKTYRGGAVPLELGNGLTAAVRDFARAEGVTTFVVLLAAFKVLLARFTGGDDICLGTPTFGRSGEEFAAVLGDFINPVPLRTRIDVSAPFRHIVAAVRDTVLGAMSHQDYPLPLMVERLQPERDAGRAPLFDCMFILQRFEQLRHVEDLLAPGRKDQEVPLGDLLLRSLDAEQQHGQMDLVLELADLREQVSGLLKYSADLIERGTAERWAAQYQTLLAALVGRPSVAVADHDLVSDPETRQLERWNATATSYPRDTVLSRLLEERTRVVGERIAVSMGQELLTFHGLDARANQLARRLAGIGVGPGTIVGIALHRTPVMLVALLAVQKAGGTYLPLDPGFPPERLAYMLGDSGATVLLSEAEVLAGLEVPLGVQVLDLPALEAELAREPADNLATSASPEDAAYIIYTSGSTGRPKGVAVSHGALVNFLWSMRREPGLAEDDVLAAVTTLSFDIAGLELYLPLLVGARIELVPREEAADGAALAARLEACGATVMQATPATWRMLVEAGWQGRPGFRALCGGEAITRDLATALTERVAELWNMYGPTETTIWSTCELVDPEDITIGKPIANTVVHILDRHGQVAPIGIPGEICIGGDGVAIGYHQRPELTAEKFVPDPTGRPGRIYRTGDLGRWRADGRLECLGRLDQQVKVRGYRIEPGEIEALLATHPAIRTVSVVAREAAPGDARLVAYVVYHPGESPTVSELRRFLRKELPDYMIPAMVVPLDALPLTANGKVDRKALPDPYRMAIHRDAEPVPPTAGMERHLADVWQEVLQLPAVGAEDNFFELGGHSLLALRATSLFEKRTGMRIDPRAFFFQSLRQIAAGLPSRAGAGA